MNEPLYTTEILRLAASIPHLGHLAGAEGEAELRSPTCGSIALVQVCLDEQGRVTGVGQKVEACAFGQASAALMGAHALGRQAAEIEQALGDFAAWLESRRDDPGDWPGLDVLAPARPRRARHGAMLLPFRALLAAVQVASRKGSSLRGLATGQ